MRVWWIVPQACILFGVALLLSGCKVDPGLPKAAKEALQLEWKELDLVSTMEPEMLRAWPGDLNRISGDFNIPNLELWCVEVQYDLQLAPSGDGNSTIWIVVKPDERSAWSASILMTMSSLWAYEACGVIE